LEDLQKKERRTILSSLPYNQRGTAPRRGEKGFNADRYVLTRRAFDEAVPHLRPKKDGRLL